MNELHKMVPTNPTTSMRLDLQVAARILDRRQVLGQTPSVLLLVQNADCHVIGLGQISFGKHRGVRAWAQSSRSTILALLTMGK